MVFFPVFHGESMNARLIIEPGHNVILLGKSHVHITDYWPLCSYEYFHLLPLLIGNVFKFFL